MPILSLAAAILAVLGAAPGATPSDTLDAQVISAGIVYAANPAGPNGLWNNVRFGLPRVPRPRVPMPGW
jgi:hypothetical protein